VRRRYADAYAEFRRLFTHLEDGRAAERLEPVFHRAARRAAKRRPVRADLALSG
jgi:hypothetical protein